MNDDEGLKVKKIEKGTVIDHISGGRALLILRVIGADKGDDTLLILVNVRSRRFGRKDIIKIENRELSQKEIDAISLIAPEAKINIINDSRIIKKIKVKLPESIEGIAKCANPSCITNTNEPVLSRFKVFKKEGEDPILICDYCGRDTRIEEGVLYLFK